MSFVSRAADLVLADTSPLDFLPSFNSVIQISDAPNNKRRRRPAKLHEDRAGDG